MDIQEWLELNDDKLATDYERLFVTEVLSWIAEIDLAAVQAQYPFKDRLGHQRCCEFLLIEVDAIKIDIEIDGYNKRGKVGMNMGEFLEWLWRQNGLSQEGLVKIADGCCNGNCGTIRSVQPGNTRTLEPFSLPSLIPGGKLGCEDRGNT